MYNKQVFYNNSSKKMNERTIKISFDRLMKIVYTAIEPYLYFKKNLCLNK